VRIYSLPAIASGMSWSPAVSPQLWPGRNMESSLVEMAMGLLDRIIVPPGFSEPTEDADDST